MWGPSEFYVTGNLADYDRTRQLRHIHVPMLFTAGRYDEATPETTRVYQQAAPGSKLVIFANSAHLAMVEETEDYVRTVREFIRDVDRQER
jgi:proline iminopeptidase